MKRAMFLTAALAAVALAGQVQAAMLTFNTTDSIIHSGETANQGWWDKSGGLNNGTLNYNIDVRDQYSTVGYAIRNFFTFDLSSLVDTAVAATLKIPVAAGSAVIGDGVEEYRVFDVSTDATTLNLNTGTNDAIWTDLGSGTSYGAVLLPNGSISGLFVEISLNSSALADINAAGGYFAIGGAITTSSGNDWIGFRSPTPVQLEVQTVSGAIPEPSSMALLGMGIAGLGGVRMRRKRKAKPAA